MSFFKVVLASALGFFASVVVVVLLFVGMIAAIVASLGSEEAPSVRAHSVLVIDLARNHPEHRASEGIDELTGRGGNGSLREVVAAIGAASTDERIAGIRLKTAGSPGTWTAAEEIRRALVEFRNSGKFIVASIGERGISEGAYFVASAADPIVAVPAANIEMNGIVAALPFFKPALDRLGIEAQVVRAGSFKSAVEPFILDSASAETRLMTRELVDGLFARFRTEIPRARKISPEALETILDTRGFLTAHEAQQVRLVDAVLFEDQIDSILRVRTGRSADADVVTIEVGEYMRSVDLDGANGAGDQVAIVYAVGEIRAGKSGSGANPITGGQTLGNETFAESMKTVRESGSVKAVVVRIDSPGGEAGASEAMWREIELTAAKKPVIASMGAIAASGGYFLAAACDTIVAEPTTLTGSIGVFGLWFTAREFLTGTLGVNVQTIRSDSLADMGSILRAPTDLERMILQRSVDSTYRKFISIVSRGRGIPPAQVDSIGQGRVYTGARAKQLGLVDELGGLARALEIAAASAGLEGEAYGLRVLPRRKSFFESLEQIFDETSTMSAVMAFFGGAVDPHEAIRNELTRRGGVQMLAPAMSIDVH